ncbi:MAG: GNAT family N-acetyltransferase [Nocardioides sp.]
MPAVVEAHAALGHWRTAWDDLVDRQRLPSPFQRSWWLESVAEQRTTYVLVVAGAELIGGLALGAGRAGARRMVAPGPAVLCPDHLDVLAEPGAEDRVVVAISRWLARGPRLLDVRGVVAGSLLERATGAMALPADRAPFQPLDGPYLAGRSSAFRRNVRRGARRLDQLGLRHRRATLAEIPDALAAFRALHTARGDRGALVAQLDPLERAVLAGARVDEARVDVLGGDRTVAVSIGFELAGRLSLYQVARSLEREHGSAGTVLLASVIEDAAAHGHHEVDLLRGAEGYKSSFADHTRPVGRLRAARGSSAVAQLRVEDAARRVSARLRSRGGSGS